MQLLLYSSLTFFFNFVTIVFYTSKRMKMFTIINCISLKLVTLIPVKELTQLIQLIQLIQSLF
jgi:Zn-dependent protease with chaperone function